MELQAQPVQQMHQMQVTAPTGAVPGQSITVNTPHGDMNVVVPAGIAAGQAFMINVPVAAAPVVVAAQLAQLEAQLVEPMAAVVSTAMPMGGAGLIPVVEGVAVTPEVAAAALAGAPPDSVPLLDPAVAGLLATVDNYTIRQRVKWWEALSQGCCEQSNTYDIIDDATGTHLFIAQEYSEDCNRCCCAPLHSYHVQFKVVNAGDRQWANRGAIDQMPTAFTAERIGCCAKPFLCCFACSDGCRHPTMRRRRRHRHLHQARRRRRRRQVQGRDVRARGAAHRAPRPEPAADRVRAGPRQPADVRRLPHADGQHVPPHREGRERRVLPTLRQGVPPLPHHGMASSRAPPARRRWRARASSEAAPSSAAPPSSQSRASTSARRSTRSSCAETWA
jgi:hypothetical protein